MDPDKKARLEAAGWIEVSIEEFLGTARIPDFLLFDRKHRCFGEFHPNDNPPRGFYLKALRILV